MDFTMKIIIGGLILVYLLMIPVQYVYIKELNKDPRRNNKTQSEYYEDMSPQEEGLHLNAQVGLFWPSTFAASLIYKFIHRKRKLT